MLLLALFLPLSQLPLSPPMLRLIEVLEDTQSCTEWKAVLTSMGHCIDNPPPPGQPRPHPSQLMVYYELNHTFPLEWSFNNNCIVVCFNGTNDDIQNQV